ncbi:hypothetical protein WCT79_20310 [Pectobacterium carotovorum]|uniref:hypothetical protein n=1 Tax=Pectobacterium carotovorum TaxID=554 RepID=UPI0030197656
MNNLEKLSVQQAVLTAEIKEWKSKSGDSIDKCEAESDEDFCRRNKECGKHIQAARKIFLSQDGYYYERVSFGEILMNEFCCPHCHEWHRIQRKEILPRKLKLRSVRAAITRIGKKLNTATSGFFTHELRR